MCFWQCVGVFLVFLARCCLIYAVNRIVDFDAPHRMELVAGSDCKKNMDFWAAEGSDLDFFLWKESVEIIDVTS